IRGRQRDGRADVDRKHGSVRLLLVALLVNLVEERLVAVDDARYAHLAGRVDAPAVLGHALEPVQIHGEPSSYVDDALSEPRAFRQLLDAQARERRALHLDARRMLRDVDPLAVGDGTESRAVDLDAVATEQHAARGHLVNDGIQEIDEKELEVRRLAMDLRAILRGDVLGFSNDGRQCKGRLLEGLRGRGTDAAHANVRTVRKMLVASV